MDMCCEWALGREGHVHMYLVVAAEDARHWDGSSSCVDAIDPANNGLFHAAQPQAA